MKLINDSSLSTTNPVLIDKSPVKDDQLANVLSPLTNYPTIIDDNLPSTDDYQIKDNSSVSDDDKLINDESIEDYDPEDNYLKNLKEENEIIMKQFDDRIEKFQTKIKKVTQELQQMNRNLKELIVQKEQKYNEFIQILNEHKRKLKNKK
jgi:septal ring factor EnvC (AmiA/AmiB activator)